MAKLNIGLVKSVAVIGGGPCGAATIKALLKEAAFSKIVGFERRAGTGGLWNYYDSNKGPEPTKVPSTDPHRLDSISPIRLASDKYVWPSAIYELMDTNVPYHIMEYSGFPFPKNSPLFPTKQQVLEYIQEYSKEVEPYIHFGTNVVSVKFRPDETHRWQVTYRKVCDATAGGLKESPDHPDQTEEFDAVLVASGHYELPYVPEKPGLADWALKFPGSVSHSKNYRHPRQFENLDGNLVVVGNSASGSDLAYQLASYLNRKVYKSARSKSMLPGGSSDYIITVPDIASFEPETKSIRFQDGTVVENVAHIIFATGFLRHYPFLDEINSSQTPIVTDGLRLHGLYKQCVSYNFPGLALIATPRYVLPTRLSETQAIWLAKIFQGQLELPSIEEMKQDELRTVELMGDSPKFHNLFYPDDVRYAKELNNQIYSTPDWDSKLAPVEWNERDMQYRASATAMKEAYIRYRELNNGERVTDVDALRQGVEFELEPVDEEVLKL
ncbi:hypothetical protein OGAPHI_000928 [Ogataea philodendri]|uniref:Flavin-containing monooxygenase n=1 Tax=Ogataea philodendri TaxID=1378263 RepID=A0A9P8T8L9_9ASCO|nr:uncharacterized protein OGAPHI_000928 [Ogataea philodendri]KAH3670413.1 hypothetical protein OGAPHI_000928 [Ogataea philodendri]